MINKITENKKEGSKAFIFCIKLIKSNEIGRRLAQIIQIGIQIFAGTGGGVEIAVTEYRSFIRI